MHQSTPATRTPFELRSYVEALEAAGQLVRHRVPVPLRHVAKVIHAHESALLIERPIGYAMPILANCMAVRPQFAVAFGVPESELLREMSRRARVLIPPVRVDDGPVREVVQVGEEADLTSLPIYLQHELDGAPYITAALDVSKHPETGRYNVGVRRLMLRGPRETGVDVVSPTDLRAYYKRARELGRRLEIAFVVGAHPLDYLASQLKTPADDEFEVLGGFRGEPVPLVHCETVDLEVPADAEIVLEGYLEGDWTEVEGPFGEYTGAYGAAHMNPIFKLTAITRRRDAIFETATIGGSKLHFTDQAGLLELGTEYMLWESISRAVAFPIDIYCPPEATGLHHARIAIRQRDPGDGKNAVVAALGSNAQIKMAIVVDDDIDIFDARRVEWAVATRYQADRDTVIVSGLRTLPLDPSLPLHEGSKVTTAKLGLDATRGLHRPAEAFSVPRIPFQDADARFPGEETPRVSDIEVLAERLRETLPGGPEFIHWLTEFSDVHDGDIVRALGLLRSSGAITMDRDGRYWPAGEGGGPGAKGDRPGSA